MGSGKENVFSVKESKFINEYLLDFNGTQACIRAGYSKKSAAVIACEYLRKPKIANEIKRRLEALTITAESAAKIISDIAASRLNDFMIVKKVLRTPNIRKSLTEIIDKLKLELEFEDEYAAAAQYNSDELQIHETNQKLRRRKIIRYELELSKNPDAYRDVAGEPEWVESVELDLVAIAKAKESGRIKKLKFTDKGPEIEFYAADAAADRLLQYYGKITQRVEHTGADGSPLFPDDPLKVDSNKLVISVVNASDPEVIETAAEDPDES